MTQSVDNVPIAIVGTGGIAAAHAAGIASLGARASLVAAVDLDAGRVQAFCREHQIPRSYTDLSEMLSAERPRLVTICTPPMTHCGLSIRCMQAGAWVLCEKPLCASLAELDRLEEAERLTGCYTSSVFQLRFGSGVTHFKQRLDGGVLGRPLVCLCNTTWYRDDAYYSLPWRGTWSAELGGPTMGHGIHAMDLMLYLLGDWQEVRALTATVERPIEVEDVSVAAVRFASGAVGSVVNSVLSPRQESYLRFDLQRGTLELRHLYKYANRDWTWTPRANDEGAASAWGELSRETPPTHGSQIASMLDSMERGERPPVSGGDVRRTIDFISSLYKSAATGEAVRAGSIQPGDRFYHHVAGMGVAEPQTA